MKKAVIILSAILTAIILFAVCTDDTKTPAQKAQEDLAAAQALTQSLQQAYDEQMQKIEDMQDTYDAYINAQNRLGN